MYKNHYRVKFWFFPKLSLVYSTESPTDPRLGFCSSFPPQRNQFVHFVKSEIQFSFKVVTRSCQMTSLSQQILTNKSFSSDSESYKQMDERNGQWWVQNIRTTVACFTILFIFCHSYWLFFWFRLEFKSPQFNTNYPKTT